MAQALPINRLVNVSVNLSPSAAQMQNTSTLLILGSSNVIDVTERFRSYTSLAAVSADFGTSAPEYLAANLWFQQAPQPTTLQIGRWALTAVAAALRGATLSLAAQAVSLWTAVASGAFEVVVNGIPSSVTGLNFSAVTNLNGVASIIQTGLAAVSTGATVVWNSIYGRFEVQSGTTGVTSTLGFIQAPTATGSFSFSANPTAADTITLNGTVVTFVAAGPIGNQVLLGATLSVTLANLLVFLQASADVQLVKFVYYANGTTLYLAAAATGAGGNSLTITKTSTVITASGVTLSGGTGTDISTLMGAASTNTGAYVVQGIAAETALAAATLFDANFGQNWYALTLIGAASSDHLAVANYIEGATNRHIYGVSTQDSAVITAAATTDIAYQLAKVAPRHTCVQYSSSTPYSVCSLLGRILTVNYQGNNTVITLMYKQEPGIVPETLNASQIVTLESKNCNVFVAYNNNTAIIEPGVASSGDFLDIITGTDWLSLDIQTTVYNLLYASTTKIPQTDAGNQLLVTAIEGECARAVTNGLLAPGTWQVAGFGGLNQGDFLPKGFYVYAPPIATQTASTRAARQSVPIQVAAKLAGAIHTVSVSINVNR